MTHLLPINKRDWPEDSGQENGNYLNKCLKCGSEFVGHKDRGTCKVCFTNAAEAFARMSPAEQLEVRVNHVMALRSGDGETPGKAVNVCGALYLPAPAHVDDLIVNELLALPWLKVRDARQEYFMATTPREYSYGNRGTGAQTYQSSEFSPVVRLMMNKLNELLKVDLNVCFLNKYDNEKHHLGWHADDFPGMRKDQPIIVVSYGAEREIWLKDKRGFPCPDPLCEHRTCHDTGFVQAAPGGKQPANQRVLLQHGSVFIMPPGYQNTHLHRIPKHDRPCGWRISLTFRSFE